MTLTIECPNCEHSQKIEYEDLPGLACEETDIECEHCDAVMQVGWVCEAEVRGHIISSNSKGE